MSSTGNFASDTKSIRIFQYFTKMISMKWRKMSSLVITKVPTEYHQKMYDRNHQKKILLFKLFNKHFYQPKIDLLSAVLIKYYVLILISIVLQSKWVKHSPSISFWKKGSPLTYPSLLTFPQETPKSCRRCQQENQKTETEYWIFNEICQLVCLISMGNEMRVLLLLQKKKDDDAMTQGCALLLECVLSAS